ncbi:hypothetical protein GWI33_021351, partial [Rhynchophorus ferrugineus]
IHDTTYGGGSDEDGDYVAFHQSAAANALLYVGLGTTAIGSVIFFVGTGEKGFKTLELRLIGPTLIVAGLLCCLVRVLLCACPTSCFRPRSKTRLKDNLCPHKSSRRRLAQRYPDVPESVDFVPADKTALLHKHTRKKVSIVPPNYSLPSTSTSEFKELPSFTQENEIRKLSIPQIHLPSLPDSEEHSKLSRDDSVIELTAMDLNYDVQSVSSNESDQTDPRVEKSITASKLTRQREPASVTGAAPGKTDDHGTKVQTSFTAETMSVVIEHSDNLTEGDGGICANERGEVAETNRRENRALSDKHSGIVLSPLQLGQ